MINITKFDLISNIISLINSEEYESTITNMSASLKVPVQYLRKTILTLVGNQILQACLNTLDDYETEDDVATFIERFIVNPEAVSDALLAGDYDDIVWEINLKYLNNNEQELLPLTHLEYGVLKSLGESIISIKRGSIFEIKDTINPISPTIKKYKEVIQDAIYAKKQIFFNYLKYNSETCQLESVSVMCFPQDIITNISDNWIYMQSTDLKLYRLDRIVPPCRMISNSPVFPGITENPNKKYMWGAFSKPDDTPIHVKLRIAPETRNIISKIKRDTSLRSATNKFYQDGNFYYYEDDIIGIDEFQRWIRSYGSSIVVIEPTTLRDSILDRAEQALNLYTHFTSWGDL